MMEVLLVLAAEQTMGRQDARAECGEPAPWRAQLCVNCDGRHGCDFWQDCKQGHRVGTGVGTAADMEAALDRRLHTTKPHTACRQAIRRPP